MSNPSDHDLTVMVDRAAHDLTESRAAYIPGSPKWGELGDGDKNLIREQALPFIFHGTKALEELGYRKPRTITTAEELDALPTGSIVRDAYAVACQRTSKWINHQWDRIGHAGPHRPYLPATVLWEPQS